VVNLRPLKSDDLERVIIIQERITRKVVSPAWRQMVGEHVGAVKQPGIVAEAGGQVVGFIIGEIKVGGFGTELSGWIEMAGVAPDHMGAGVGRALAQAMLEHFKAQGVEEVMTSVRWDSGDMLAFFKNLGFDRSPLINLRLRLSDG